MTPTPHPTHQLSCSHWTAQAAATALPQVAWLPAHRKPLVQCKRDPCHVTAATPHLRKEPWRIRQALAHPCLTSFFYSYRNIHCAYGWPSKRDMSQLPRLLGMAVQLGHCWWRGTRNVKALNFQATLLKLRAPSSPSPYPVFLSPWLDVAMVFSQGRSCML